MKRTVLFLLVTAVSGLARADTGSPPAPIVPMELPTQGYLLDSNNKPVTQQGLKITFSLYPTDTSPSLLWQETDSVDVQNGYYALDLGEITPLTGESLATPLYLGVSIGGAQEMQPRLKVGSVPFALEAELAHNLSGGTITGATITNSSVDATQVSIGGTPVIDASGEFLGTAKNADDLAGVPASSYLSSNGGDGSKLSNLNPAALSPGIANIDITGNAATATSAKDFSGTLSGDVTGTQDATVVGGLRGVSVSSTAPTATEVLRYDATAQAWVPAPDVSSFNGRTGVIVPMPGDYGFSQVAGQATNSQLQGPLVRSLAAADGSVSVTTPSGVGPASVGVALDGSTLQTGANGVKVNLANPNTWTGAQSFSGGATVSQTAAGKDVLDVTSADGRTQYLGINSAGNVAFSGAASFPSGVSASTFTGNVPLADLEHGTAAISISGNAATATSFTGPLSGDVNGTESSTVVTGIQGTPVSSAAPTASTVLRYTGGRWAPTQDVASFDGRTGAVVPLANDYDFSMLSGSATDGQLAGPLVKSITVGNGLTASNPNNQVGAATLGVQLSDSTLSNGPSGLGVNLGNANSWTAAQTFSGSATVTTSGNTASLTVNQTGFSSPTADVLDVNSARGATRFFKIDSNGNATFYGTVNAAQFSGSSGSSVDVNLPLTGNGTSATPITIPQASGSASGYLASGDWASFNAKAASGPNSDITSLAGLTTALPVGEGGTGVKAVPAGDLLVGAGSGLSPLAGPTGVNQVLRSTGAGTFAWGSLTTNDLPSGIPNGNLANSSLTIAAGSGLTGGGSVSLGGTTTLAIGTGGVTNGMLANSSLTITAGSGLTGGGSVSLGGFKTLSIANGGVTNTMLANDSFTLAAGNGISISGSPVALGATATLGVNLADGSLTSTGGLAVNMGNANTWAGAQTFTNATFTNPASGNITGSAASFTGSLVGDVTGTQGATSVVGLRGTAISTTPPTSGQVLSFDGTRWSPAADVASFNGRTGTVTLSGSDVTGALGYTPVNKAGDTMTGALTVTPSGGATAPLTVNPGSGQSGDLTDWQVNGVTEASVSSAGDLQTNGVVEVGADKMKLWEAVPSGGACAAACGTNSVCLSGYNNVKATVTCSDTSAKYCACVGF